MKWLICICCMAITFNSFAQEVPPSTGQASPDKKIKKSKSILSGTLTRPDFKVGEMDISEEILGIRLGSFNARKLGFYWTLEANKFIIELPDYTFNSQENTNPFPSGNIQLQDDSYFGIASSSMGFTKRVAGPAWIYFGGGANFYREYRKALIYDDRGNFLEEGWAEDVGNQLRYNAEIGILFNLLFINVGIGVKSYDVKQFKGSPLYFVGTAGFSFTRK